MTITLNNVSKRFDREWIIKDLSCTFESETSYAILGPNGSGKSTLMKLLSGSLTASSGEINYKSRHKTIPIEEVYQSISYCAPYLQLIDEMTINEVISFHFQFKSMIKNVEKHKVLELLMLDGHGEKELSHLSSGMMQRLKVGLTLLSDTEIILLDEPATNLDEQGVRWYREMVSSYSGKRLIVVSSNRQEEYDFCTERLNVTDFKTS